MPPSGPLNIDILGSAVLHSFATRVAYGKDAHAIRANVDVLFFILADDPPDSVMNSNRDQRYHGSRLDLKMGTGGPTFIFSDHYTAWGLLYDYWLPTDQRALSWGFRIAPRRYDYTKAQPWRVDTALQASVGIEVLNLVVAIERGHAVAPDGRFRPETFASMGVDLAVASDWKIYGRRYLSRGWRCLTGRCRKTVRDVQ